MPQQQLVEIAAALGAKARILILDEPTASLSERGDASNLFRVIRELRRQGVGIIYISHRLDELSQIADRVTVLRDGRYVATRPMSEVDRAELIRLMVGRRTGGGLSQSRTVTPGRRGARSSARSAAARAACDDVSLSGARRGDRRTGRAGRRRPDGAGPGPVRPDAGRSGADSLGAASAVPIDRPPQRPSRWASPTCRRIAAGTA